MAKLSLFGDSMIDTGLDTSNLRTLNRWLSGPLVSLLGPAFEDYYNHGVGGDTIDDCLTRIATVTGSDADYVLVECGINDLSRPETTLDSMTDGYENIIRALKVANKKIICCTVLERKLTSEGGAVAVDQYAIRPQFNDWLRDAYDRGSFDALVDFDAGSGFQYKAVDYADDNTHPNTNVCVKLANIMAGPIKALLAANSVAEETLGSNLLVEPQLMGNEGTSTNSYISGDIATGWRWLDAQTGTETITCETILNGTGGAQKLTFAGTPSGTSIGDFFRDNQSSIDITSGQTVQTSFKLKTEGLKGIVGIYSQLSLPLTGGTEYLNTMYVGPSDTDTDYRQIASDEIATFHSIPYTAPEDLTGCTFRIAIYYLDNTELSGSATIYEPQVRIVS